MTLQWLSMTGDDQASTDDGIKVHFIMNIFYLVLQHK